jgi:16S rRNA processing protein RimM
MAEPNTVGGEEKVLLARIGAAHGVRGEVRIKAFTADPLSLAGYGPLSAGTGGRSTSSGCGRQRKWLLRSCAG